MPISKYELYLREHMQAIDQSGYHGMSEEEQCVITLMSYCTCHSFLSSINIVQCRLAEGWTLDMIKHTYNLRNREVSDK